MADTTQISWADSTFNPWVGCTKVGPGCDNCYAEADFDKRRHVVQWGTGNLRHRTAAGNWAKPLRWNRNHDDFRECDTCGWRGEANGANGSSEHSCRQPGCEGYLEPVRRRVFCASLADVFDNEVDPQWRVDLFALIEATPNLDWLLLTKRIGNVGRMIPDRWSVALPRHVQLGITVVTPEEASRDIPKLLSIKMLGVRFLSMEPLLDDVDLSPHLYGRAKPCAACPHDADCECGYDSRNLLAEEPSIGWVIVGGESGSHARPMVLGHAKDIVRQCNRAGIPVFVKQLGARPVNREGLPHPISDKKGAVMAEWPEILRVRQFPEAA